MPASVTEINFDDIQGEINLDELLCDAPVTTMVVRTEAPSLDAIFDGKKTAKGQPLTVKLASRTVYDAAPAADLMSQILALIRVKQMTCKQIAKELKADKHAVNSLLYKALQPKLVVMIKPEGQMAPLWKA